MNKLAKSTDGPWPHRIGIMLVVIVFPLIWVGGLVTTTDAGMAVPDWPNTYGYNLFSYPYREWFFGPWDLFVEHGHRLLGAISGMLAIALVVVTWLKESRRWVLGLAIAILLLVIFQGALGGTRVVLDERWIAKAHGCVGPFFFATAVAYCVVTSRWWISKPQPMRPGLMRLGATSMLIISYGQLVLGAFLRHIPETALPKQFQMLVVGHVLTAILILIGTIIQLVFSRSAAFRGKGIQCSIAILGILVGLQCALGLATWVVKFGWPVWFENMSFAAGFTIGEKEFWQVNIVTAHVAIGSAILAMWTVHAMRCWRLFKRVAPQPSQPASGSVSASAPIT